VVTKDWQGWFIGGAVLQFFVIIGMLWLPESPEFYFAKGRFAEAKSILLLIAKVNGRSIGEESICFDNVGHETNDGSGSDNDIVEESST